MRWRAQNLRLFLALWAIVLACPAWAAAEEEGRDQPTPEVAPAHKPAGKKRPARPRCDRFAPGRYRAMAARWVKPVKPTPPQYRDGFHDVLLVSINHGEQQKLHLFDEAGEIDEDALAKVVELMRDKDTEECHPVEPRLLKLLYKLTEHFGVRRINIISGFRSADDPDEESHHHRGRAIDITLPGVPLAALARKARTLGHVGVGLYPVSGFVHIDVRDGPSYFWVDPSGPGKRACFRPLSTEVGAKADRKWSPQKDNPTPQKDAKGEVLGARSDPLADVGCTEQP